MSWKEIMFTALVVGIFCGVAMYFASLVILGIPL